MELIRDKIWIIYPLETLNPIGPPFWNSRRAHHVSYFSLTSLSPLMIRFPCPPVRYWYPHALLYVLGTRMPCFMCSLIMIGLFVIYCVDLCCYKFTKINLNTPARIVASSTDVKDSIPRVDAHDEETNVLVETSLQTMTDIVGDSSSFQLVSYLRSSSEPNVIMESSI
ncbi:unnamed protein product [Rotaria socialis]|uniref:Uncharacterized protein n=1 Tax=Rotaria socialis TaxID=392032 RepID=A0A821S032_9BILA|nr:unnamed protein product [Rotaria socialis]